jgi:hypothetical protein
LNTKYLQGLITAAFPNSTASPHRVLEPNVKAFLDPKAVLVHVLTKTALQQTLQMTSGKEIIN